MDLTKKLFCLCLMLAHIINGENITESLNQFTINLLTETSKLPHSPKNLALSPFTVWTLLSIIDEGARGNTAQQLEKVLRIPDKANKKKFRLEFNNMSKIISVNNNGVKLDLYSSIFCKIDCKLKNNYGEIVKENYNVNIQVVDFKKANEASDKINNYVAQATKNRIKNFIRADDLTNAQIFMVSALYFKGNWMRPFMRNMTKRSNFYDDNGNKIGSVDMMHQRSPLPYAKLEWIKAVAVELPYGNDAKMSMIVILPYKDQSVQDVLVAMNRHSFNRILNKLEKAKADFEDEDIEVFLPKFKISSDLTLNEVLQNMGIRDVFNENEVDLIDMFNHFFFVSKLVQRAEIEVNEEGTTATAASGASVVNKIPPSRFMANKPFLYFIVDRTVQAIIFAGKMGLPT